ncbi:MAG: PotD/PotF family extracellular solute-binding protein [Verrucomicrobiales bacterium]
MPLLAAVAFWLISCRQAPSLNSRSTQLTPPNQPLAPPRLVLLAMQDFIDADILRQFEKETGIGIDHMIYEDPEEIIPRLRSQPGSADIVIVDSFTISDLRELRLLCPIRPEALPNRQNIDPRHRALPFDPKEEFSVPYHWGTTLIAYRKDLLPNPSRSWRLLWDPALQGRIMMLNDFFEPMAVTMILNQIDPQTPTESGYIQAADALSHHLESMRARYGTDDQIKDALVAGTVTAAMCYSGDAAVAARENPHIDFFIPEEGAMIWVDCLAICRDTQDADSSHQFLNFFLRPEIAARNAAAINYVPANRAAEALLSEDLKNDPRLYPPPELRAKLQHVPSLDEEMDSLAKRYWHWFRGRLVAAESAEAAPADPDRKARSTP